MPTSFTSPTNGQTADASHVTQFVAPINNLESGAALYAESAGSATVYTATLDPVPALVAGLTIRLKIDETNSGAATLNVNSTGAVDIRYDNGSAYNTALPASFLKAGGVYQFTYNGTYWLVTGGAAAGGGSVATLDDVGDVDVTGAANGTVLMKVTGGWEDRNLAIADINSLQTELDGKSATSHTHSLDNLSDVAITTPTTRNVVYYNGSAFVNQNLETNDIQSGNFATARLASGTASNGLLPVSNGSGAAVWGGTIAASQLGSGTANSTTFLRGDGSWAAASGGSGLPTDGSGSMTGPLIIGSASNVNFPVTTASPVATSNWGLYNDSVGLRYQAPSTTGYHAFYSGTQACIALTATQNANYVPMSFIGTQTSAGASVANIWRDSSAGLNINVAAGAQINFRRDGTLLGYFGGTTYGFDIGDYIGTGAGIVKYTSVTIYSVTPSMVAHTTGNATICAGATGTTYPEVVAHGLSETAYAGAIEVKAGAVARTNNGTWTNVFSLAKGEYHGDFWIYDNIGDGHGRLPISNTTLGAIQDNASAPTYVDSGSEAAGNIAFRVSGGNLQVNVGTSVTASLELSIIFKGLVT